MSFNKWEECLFEEIMLIPLRNGLSKPKAIRGSGKKMVNMGEIFQYDRIYDIEMDRVPTSDKEYENSKLEKGDLLFARQSLVWEGAGKCSIIMEANEDLVYESHIIRVRLNKNLVDPFFYFYYFNSYYGKENIKSIVEQVAAAGIRGSDLKKLKVPKPSYAEQTFIAKTFSCLDDKIELNNRINKTLEEMAQAIFKSWFVDFEPFKDGEFEDSELGMIPKGWRVGTLGEYCDIQKGLSYKGEHLTDDGIPMINLGNVQPGGEFRYDKMKYYNGEYKERHIVKSGDIIIANTDMTADRVILGSPIFVPRFKTKNVIFTHHLFAFSSLKLPKAFLYYYLKSNTFRERAESYANGTTVLALSKEDVLSIKMIIPDKSSLDSFSGLVDTIINQKEQLTEESNRLYIVRDTLLPKLMSGEIRVPIEEVQ